MDEDDFTDEQNSVARLIQMLYNDDPEEMLKVSLDFGNFVLLFCTSIIWRSDCFIIYWLQPQVLNLYKLGFRF